MMQPSGTKKIRLAFIGQHGLFAGNCKYLFLSSLDDERFESTYITDLLKVHSDLSEHGLPVITMEQAIAAGWSFADVLVLDDGVPENIKSTFGSRPLVQLWHGIGPKMAGLAQIKAGTIELPDWHKLLIETIYTGYDLVCATSNLCELLYRNYFSASAFSITGMCRNDAMFRAADARDLIGSANVKGLESRFNVMLAMTFRESGSILKNILDDELLDLFRAYDINLIVKPHPYEEIPADLASKCTIVDPSADIYPLLHQVDVMITDFSSIASDYILLDKPVIHWTPDRENYHNTCRDMSYDPNIFRLGFWARDKGDLLEEVVRIRSGTDGFRDQRTAICSLLHAFKDGSSCERTLAEIEARYRAFEERGLELAEARWQKRRLDRPVSNMGARMAELDELRGKANHQLCIAVQESDYETARANVKIIDDIEPIEACVIGDSHVWGYAVPRILPVWLGAITMHRFGRDNGEIIKLRQLGLDPGKTKLIFNFGEIDARSHVGVQAKRQNRSELEICENLVDRYIAAVRSVTRGWSPEAVWIATTVPPHEIPATSPHAFVNAPPLRERIDTFRILNGCLMRKVARSSFRLLDAYSLLATSEGTLPDGLTNDDIHIYTEGGRALLRSYCEKIVRPTIHRDWLTAQRLTILGKPDAVAHMFESERRSRELSPDENHYFGRALLEIGETDEAISLLEQVRHSCSEPPWADLYLARAYREKGRISECTQLLSEIFSYNDLNEYFTERLHEEVRLTESAIAK